MPYAKSCRAVKALHGAKPDPGLLFDCKFGLHTKRSTLFGSAANSFGSAHGTSGWKICEEPGGNQQYALLPCNNHYSWYRPESLSIRESLADNPKTFFEQTVAMPTLATRRHTSIFHLCTVAIRKFKILFER